MDNTEEKIPLIGAVVSGSRETMVIRFTGATGKMIRDDSFFCLLRLTLRGNGIALCLEELETACKFISLEYPAHTVNVKTGSEQG
jgi:hypothetical protein